MNYQVFLDGYKLEKQAIDWMSAIESALPSAGIGAAIGAVPSALYGGLTAKKDESPWWRAAEYGLGGAGIGGLAGGGYGMYNKINDEFEKLKSEHEQSILRKQTEFGKTQGKLLSEKENIEKELSKNKNLLNEFYGNVQDIIYPFKDSDMALHKIMIRMPLNTESRIKYINNWKTIGTNLPGNTFNSGSVFDVIEDKFPGKFMEELDNDELFDIINIFRKRAGK